jgi:hypothetical protein
MGGGEEGEQAPRTEESPSGGVDVWSDAVSSHPPEHLLVMVHGILGRCALTPPPFPPAGFYTQCRFRILVEQLVLVAGNFGYAPYVGRGQQGADAEWTRY